MSINYIDSKLNIAGWTLFGVQPLIMKSASIFLIVLIIIETYLPAKEENSTGINLIVAPVFTEFKYWHGSDWASGYDLSLESQLWSNLYVQIGYVDFGETRVLYNEELKNNPYIQFPPTGESDISARGSKLGLLWKQSFGVNHQLIIGGGLYYLHHRNESTSRHWALGTPSFDMEYWDFRPFASLGWEYSISEQLSVGLNAQYLSFPDLQQPGNILGTRPVRTITMFSLTPYVSWNFWEADPEKLPLELAAGPLFSYVDYLHGSDWTNGWIVDIKYNWTPDYYIKLGSLKLGGAKGKFTAPRPIFGEPDNLWRQTDRINAAGPFIALGYERVLFPKTILFVGVGTAYLDHEQYPDDIFSIGRNVYWPNHKKWEWTPYFEALCKWNVSDKWSGRLGIHHTRFEGDVADLKWGDGDLTVEYFSISINIVYSF